MIFNPPGQKFPTGTRVHIAKNLGSTMSHFQSGIDAIIYYTYAQEYGGRNVKDYGLIVLDKEPYYCAWYHEHQLTKVKGHHIAEGLKIIAQYKKQRYLNSLKD